MHSYSDTTDTRISCQDQARNEVELIRSQWFCARRRPASFVIL
jgi:hypothetical protein